ncbi:unnamed protein product, partial [Meganyctiphanes norvegica]
VNATCKDVRCWHGQRCLTDANNNRPQCTMCGTLESCQASAQKVCGSDGRTYTSWCALRHEACRSGRSIVTVPHQKCVKNEAKDKECNKKRDRKHKEKGSKKVKELLDNYMDSEEDEVNMKNHKYKNISKGPVAIILSDSSKFTNGIETKKTNSDSNQFGSKTNSNNNSNSSSSSNSSTSSTKKQRKSEKHQRKKKRKDCKKNRRKNKRGRKSKKISE